MSINNTLVEKALGLKPQDKIVLIEALVSSLDKPDPKIAKMWLKEAEARLKAYRAGHKVIIHKTDGSTSVQHFKLEEGAVMLEPDVRKYFANSESVNKALRSLIAIFPSKKRASAHSK